MYKIDKTFEFCYGHRVWTQVLDGRFSDDLQCACRHLHGHEAKVQVFMAGGTLNPHGMVTDFRHLEWFKKWINKYVDHRFIIDISDPLFVHLFPENICKPLWLESIDGSDDRIQAGWTVEKIMMSPDSPEDLSGPMQELFEGALVVDFPPTSEHLARWALTLVQHRMKALNVEVSQVDWWETPKSRSSYIASPILVQHKDNPLLDFVKTQ